MAPQEMTTMQRTVHSVGPAEGAALLLFASRPHRVPAHLAHVVLQEAAEEAHAVAALVGVQLVIADGALDTVFADPQACANVLPGMRCPMSLFRTALRWPDTFVFDTTHSLAGQRRECPPGTSRI